jgi:argininosuccinate lyase
MRSSKHADQILFIESNSTGTGRLFAVKARGQGLHPVLLASNPDRYPFVLMDEIESVAVDTGSDQAMMQVARKLARRGPIAGVFSSSEYFIGASGKLAAELGLPGPRAEAVHLCRHKGQQRLQLERAGLLTPKFTLARSPEEALSAAQRIGPPVILKPVLGTGSSGVRLCWTDDEVLSHASALLKQRVNERGMPIPEEILVEEFIQGPEISVESFHQTIIGVTAKRVTNGPWFVETGHDYPARKSGMTPDVHRVTLCALKCLGLTWGPIHIEVRLSDKGPIIIEVNPRLAGGFIPELIRLATGIDLIQEIIHAVTGKPVDLKAKRKDFASLRFVMAPSDGVITQIAGVESSLALDGVESVVMYKREGQACGVTHDFRDRIGHLIAVSDHPDKASDAAEKALRMISVRLRGDTGRLKKPPNRFVHRILLDAPPETRAMDLTLISQVDLAHVLMLSECGILKSEDASRLLRAILELRDLRFAPLQNRPQERGLFLMYEGYLREVCGEKTGGMLQLGRSRNDLNATVSLLKTRLLVKKMMSEALRLQAALIGAARRHITVLMPAYTHGQAAVPITYGHYLAGIAEAMSREINHLFASMRDLSRSPLGAGAAGGSSLPIDPERTARLLGFTTVCANSLDAVASRDYALRLLACATGISVVLSRVASDFFQWCASEFSFLNLPDDLVGSSSAMPQKRNPFLLEHIAGRAGLTLGRYTSAAAAMSHAPFSNSIAVGAEGVKTMSAALVEVSESMFLLRLFVRAAVPNRSRMLERARQGHTIALEFANRLVMNSGLDFRSAHYLTGELVNHCIARGGELSDEISAEFLLRHGLSIGEEPLTVARVAADARSGGGPAEESVLKAVEGLKFSWLDQRSRYNQLQRHWRTAESELMAAVEKRNLR